ncbi:MAG: McrC family protein [Chloroflexota bacterium]|nr:McrC family protein [Chloroflexota bacterium]
MERLQLVEHTTKFDFPLTFEQRRDLHTLAPGLAITPSLYEEGRFDLNPGSVVGAISLPDLAIEIQPKLPISRVLFLISYAIDAGHWKAVPFDFGEDRSLLEAIIPGFAAMVGRAFTRGVLQGYREQEAALTTVRGRLRFDDQLREHYGRAPPFEVRYDEFTEDITENQLVKAAIWQLCRLRIRSAASRAAMERLLARLENVHFVGFDARQLPVIEYTRLNEHYRSAVELAKLILLSLSFELRHGVIRATAFTVDMAAVFETFVYVALRDVLQLRERAFPRGAQGRSLVLDQAGAVNLRPDLSWWEGGACTFVGDVKYKRIKAAGFLHADLYQLLAYTTAADVPGGLLIYAAGEEEPATHEVLHADKRLEVATLDLASEPDAILTQIGKVAQRIREMRRPPQQGA